MLGAALMGAAQAQITVMAPRPLKRSLSRGKVEGSTSTFGAPFYGDKIVGQLVYPKPTSSDRPHCTKEDYDVAPIEAKDPEHEEEAKAPLMRIFVVHRGGCSFVTKVQIAQDKGAEAVIIVDQEPTRTIKDIRRIIVADDGYGATVKIPSILVPNAEGTKLIDAAKDEKSEVVVELDWQVPTDHVVRVDMWMSAGSIESQRFLHDFATSRKALNDALRFIPHYAVFSMDKSESGAGSLCEDGSESFCAEDPDGPGNVTGRMVLDEDVRQLCIHETYKKTTSSGWHIGSHRAEYAKEYWDYVERFSQCKLDGETDETKFGKTCSKIQMKAAGIDVDAIERCTMDNRYSKLKEQRANTAWSPRAIRINGWRYNGALDADVVTKAICAAFKSPPAACKDLITPVTKWRTEYTALDEGGVSFFTFVIVVVIFNLIAFGGLMIYKRSLKNHIHSTLREEVMLEVQAQMGAYKELQDV